MDEWLFWLFHSPAGYGGLIDWVAYLLAEWTTPIFALLLVLRWFLPHRYRYSQRRIVILAVLTVLIAMGFTPFIELTFYRTRPFLALEGAHNLLRERPEGSFPSTHGIAGFALAVIMGWRAPVWGAVTWALALATGWARVYGGAHYPGDMLGALLLSGMVGLVMLRLRGPLTPVIDEIAGWLGAGSRAPKAKS